MDEERKSERGREREREREGERERESKRERERKRERFHTFRVCPPQYCSASCLNAHSEKKMSRQAIG